MRLLPKHTNNEMRWYLVLFLLASLGGAVRKWGTNSSAVSNVILGLQMIVPFLMVYFRSPNCYTPFRQHKILLFYFFYMILHVIHPLQLTFMHGLFGILVHGGFWLGIFYYFSNRHLFDPRQYMGLFLIVAIIEVVLAFIQYQLPPNHFLNKYASDLIEVATVGDRVRVTGTFSFLSGYTAYTMFFALMVWAMIRMRLPDWMIFTAIPAGLIATFMTGSRSGLVIYFLFMGGILFREYPAGKIFSLVGRLIIPAMILTSVILLYKKIPIFEQAEKAYDNFMARVEANRKSGEQNARFTTDLWYIQNGRFKNPVFGVGLGSTYQGATQLFGTSRSVQEFGYVETEFSRLLLEGGWLVIFFKLTLGLIMALNLSFGGFMRWAVWLVVAFAQPIVYNPHNAAFLLLGIILVDNIIWRQKIEHKHQWELYQKARQEAMETTAANAQPAPIAVGTTS